MSFGRTFNEFDIGAVYRHWPGKTITEYDDHLFCLMTMNHHPQHLDEKYSAETSYGQPIVVGSLIYSLLLGMSVRDVSGAALANLETDELKHILPVFHGDTLYGESEVVDRRPSSSKPDRGVVTVETRGFNQKDQLVCSFYRKVLVPIS